MRPKRSAFTLVELLVVVAIVAVLLGLMLSAVQKVRASAARAKCLNNMKQLALATHSFQAAEGRRPYSQYGTRGGVRYGAGPTSTAWSWLARILPHVEQQSLHAAAGVPRRRLFSTSFASTPVPLFLCPSDPDATTEPRTDAGNLDGFAVGRSSYKGVAGANWGDDYDEFQPTPGPFPTHWRNKGANGSFDGQNQGDGVLYRAAANRRLASHQIADGTSQTLMIGEDVQAKNLWVSWPYANNAHGTCGIPLNVRQPGGGEYRPINWPNTAGFRSLHFAGANFALCDGSARFVSDSISLETYRSLATVAGGEVVDVP